MNTAHTPTAPTAPPASTAPGLPAAARLALLALALLALALLALALGGCADDRGDRGPSSGPGETGGAPSGPAPALVPSFTLASGFEIEGLGRAVTVADFDGDGRLDVLSGTSDAIGPAESSVNLHLAREGGRFELVSAAWGLVREEPTWGAVGLEAADGGIDVLLTSSAWDGVDVNHWVRPSASGSTFTEALADGPCGAGATMGAAMVDVDLDGDLDIVEANGSAHAYGGCMDVFLRDEEGLAASHDAGDGSHEGFGLVAGDLDGDRYPELLVAVADGTMIYENLGEPPWYAMDDPDHRLFWQVREVVEEWSMASLTVLLLDYDQDGDLDAYTCTWGDPEEDLAPYQSLLRNDGDLSFTEVAAEVGVDDAPGCMGSGTGDIDLNGWPDLYLGTGGPSEGNAAPNHLFLNTGGLFVDAAPDADVEWTGRTHGIAIVDMDDDGRMDLVANSGGAFPGQEEGLRVAYHRGESYDGIVVRLVGPEGNPTGIGAHIAAHTDLATHHAWRLRGEGFGSSVLSPTVVGLGEAETVVVEVTFPDGRVVQSQELRAPFDEVTLRWADGG